MEDQTAILGNLRRQFENLEERCGNLYHCFVLVKLCYNPLSDPFEVPKPIIDFAVERFPHPPATIIDRGYANVAGRSGYWFYFAAPDSPDVVEAARSGLPLFRGLASIAVRTLELKPYEGRRAGVFAAMSSSVDGSSGDFQASAPNPLFWTEHLYEVTQLASRYERWGNDRSTGQPYEWSARFLPCNVVQASLLALAMMGEATATPPPTDLIFLTPKELACKIGVTTTTIRNWFCNKKLRVYEERGEQRSVSQAAVQMHADAQKAKRRPK